MDQSYSDSELSMSPSQLLERLQVLRQLQLIQRGKLQQQQSLYQNSPEIPNITDIVSHFSNSTSYNTFRSLLQTHQDSSNEVSPIVSSKNTSRKLIERDFIDGVSALNLSQESEFLLNSPNSMKSKVFSDTEPIATDSLSNLSTEKSLCSKQISLDEMPILNPEKNFETLIAEKIQSEDKNINNKNKGNNLVINVKKPFLKKGEGMSRFGLQKKDLIIQHTKTLPWHRNKKATKSINKQYKKNLMPKSKPYLENIELPNHQIKVTQSCTKNDINVNTNIEVMEAPIKSQDAYVKKSLCEKNNNGNFVVHKEQQRESVINLPVGKHPLQAKEGKTWAAVLTNEQDDFLRKLKQSDYYKNFCSPSKSAVSEISCDESMIKVYQDKEIVEQKMFELLEHKVAHESFNDGNSFINRFLHKHKLECSGESTPLIMQQCLSKNPNLIHINPNITVNENENVEDNETCESDCTDGAETCSSISSCSCVTVEPASTNCTCYAETKMKSNSQINKATSNERKKDKVQMVTDVKSKSDKQCLNGNINNDNDIMKANMAEMNAKLIATSELLKERLSELEDEIETFKKENANLAKSREEIDLERQKFFEEKATYEQKFNEEKILSEYYIAEEKEKLTKQRQLYERYVKDMRGQINKKDKNEVIQLKKEINDLKEDIRIKDAKTTSTIARLRNQIKIMEKEKKTLQDEIEKLKKENRRIQHSNDVTRRLTNLKYLEQINKKLANITTKDSQPDVYLDTNIKYKAFEIEKQSRNKKIPDTGGGLRHRAKSVPNLNVTSRYAKYFSQKDYLSEVERNKTFNDALHVSPIDDNISNQGDADNLEESKESLDNIADSNEDNNLEKMYKERFQSPSPKSKVFTLSNSNDHCNINDNHSSYFKSKTSSRHNQSSTYQSNLTNNDDSAINVSYKSSRKFAKNYSRSSHDSEDLTLFYSKDSAQSSENNSLNSKKSLTSNMMTSVINNEQYQDSRMILTPEPSTSKSSLTKTNLNPTEIKKPDGSRELRFPNGNVKLISADGKYSKFLYYNGDIKENFYNEGRIKYFYAETKTFHTTHADGLEVLEFADGQVEKRYKDGSSEIRLPNGSVRYFDPKNDHVREEWRFPDGATLTVAVNGEQRIVFSNGQVEVHADDHKRREFPDGTVKLVYNDGTAETRYASGRVRIKDKHGNLIMDSAAS